VRDDHRFKLRHNGRCTMREWFEIFFKVFFSMGTVLAVSLGVVYILMEVAKVGPVLLILVILLILSFVLATSEHGGF